MGHLGPVKPHHKHWTLVKLEITSFGPLGQRALHLDCFDLH